jgi:hypothetical protein
LRIVVIYRLSPVSILHTIEASLAMGLANLSHHYFLATSRYQSMFFLMIGPSSSFKTATKKASNAGTQECPLVGPCTAWSGSRKEEKYNDATTSQNAGD